MQKKKKNQLLTLVAVVYKENEEVLELTGTGWVQTEPQRRGGMKNQRQYLSQIL